MFRIQCLAYFVSVVVLTLCCRFSSALAFEPDDYQPTGDELFDRYAMLVLEQMAAADSLNSETKEKDDFDLNLSAVADWANEYGDRSEYWELHFAVIRDENSLIDAINRGLATTAYFHVFDFAQMLETEPDLPLELTEKAIALDPDNSFYYYQKAVILWHTDHPEAAREALRQGNTAPRNEHPVPYTHRMYMKHFSDASSLDNKAVGCYTLSHVPIPLMLSVRDMALEVTQQAKTDEHAELMDECLIFYQRMGQMQNQCLIGILVATAGAGILLKNAPDVLSLNEKQLAELEEINHELNQVSKLAKVLMSDADGLQFEPNLLTWLLLKKQSTRDQWAEGCNRLQVELESLPKMQSCFNALDPPPFAAWVAESEE